MQAHRQPATRDAKAWPDWAGYWLAMTSAFFAMDQVLRCLRPGRSSRTPLDDLGSALRLGTAWTVAKFGAQWWQQTPGQCAWRKWLRVFGLSLNAQIALAFGLQEIRHLVGAAPRTSLEDLLALSVVASAFTATAAGFIASRTNASAQTKGNP